MRSRRLFIAALSFITVACSDGTAPGPAPALLTTLPRALTNEEKAVISSSNAFTLALFRTASAAEPGKNVFISPLSASMSLGMALNGARGTTFDAMRSALQFGTLSQTDINTTYKSLIALLTNLDPSAEMQIANSVWYRNTLPIAPSFVTASRDYFAAEVSPLDFTNPQQSLQAVNGWVNTKTAGRIPSILEFVGADDAMYLINAIFFKASWRNAFDRSQTKDAAFTTASGSVSMVPMMYLEAKDFRGEVWSNGTKSVDLPYGNGAFAMSVWLPPDTTTIDRFVARLTPEQIASGGSERVADLLFWMPRLNLEYRRELNPDLIGLGMGVAFGDAADFSGMTTSAVPLAISDVVQKTFLLVDEEGTEAAAVTKTGIGFTSAPISLSMRCDRPYLIVIRERLSGTIVFIGKINTV